MRSLLRRFLGWLRPSRPDQGVTQDERDPFEPLECPRCGNTRVLIRDGSMCEPCFLGATPGIPAAIRHGAEDAINDELGLPPSWRCICGGRPFVPKACPRCGRAMP